jgi:hypothetical protein
MDSLFRFLAGSSGRVARGAAGGVLVVAGLVWIRGVAGAIVAVVGLLPMAAGIFDFCLFAPLVRLPFNGEDLRARLQREAE